MSERKAWREYAHDQISELEKLIIAINRKITRMSESFTHSVDKKEIAKLNELIFEKGKYEFAQLELYRLLGSVHDEQKAPD